MFSLVFSSVSRLSILQKTSSFSFMHFAASVKYVRRGNENHRNKDFDGISAAFIAMFQRKYLKE